MKFQRVSGEFQLVSGDTKRSLGRLRDSGRFRVVSRTFKEVSMASEGSKGLQRVSGPFKNGVRGIVQALSGVPKGLRCVT